MRFNSTKYFIVSLVIAVAFLCGCSADYQPVSAKQCGAIVKHTSKILGKLASKSTTEMIKECKSYTDEQRGCAMQAKIVADIVKCSKL